VADPEQHPLTHTLFAKLGALSQSERRLALRAARLRAALESVRAAAGSDPDGWPLDLLDDIYTEARLELEADDQAPSAPPWPARCT